MRYRHLLAFVALVLLAVPIALGQTTGSVSGVVTDEGGTPLPGVIVTIAGDPLPLGRSATSLSDGSFRFIGLTPGEYRVRAELTGMGSFEKPVIVQLGKDTQVQPRLQATATAAVEVTAAAPLVDTKSTDISEVTTKAQISKLPLARTFTGMFQLAPGVVDTGIVISPTNTGFNAGGARADNTFLYDGVNVSNPFFGELYQDFSELDIQEVNITRGGISAEFGRTGGFMVNGVTRSGGNEFHGDARFEYQPGGLTADSEDPNLTSEFERYRPGVGIGGRIIEDHLFFYGSANLYRQTEGERINRTGALPDSDFDQDEFFGKLTFNPISSLLIDGSYRWRDGTITNDGITSTEEGSVASDAEIRDRLGVVSLLFTATPQLSIEAKYNHNENRNSSIPTVLLGYRPTFNPQNPAESGRYDDGTFVHGADELIQEQDFFRDEYRLSASYLFNAFGGTHDLRAGVSLSENREELERTANGWGNITNLNTTGCGAAGQPCFRAVYWLDAVQISEAETWGVFLQDRITWDRLTLNIGVLANKDEFIPNDGLGFDILRGDHTVPVSNASIPTCATAAPDAPACTYRANKTFDFEDQIQPRIGIAYVVSKNVGDKAYANFGRYSNMDNQSFSRSAAPIRLVRSTAIFNRTTGALVSDVVANNQTNKRVLEDIDPMRTDEFITGYARPLGGGWAAEIWGMYRKTENIIEDFPRFNQFRLNPNGTCCNTSVGGFGYGNVPGYRKYRAVSLEVKKALRNNWSADISYTLSRLEGNWDIDYAQTVFYSSSYIDDGPLLYVNTPERDGILAGDRTHVGKIFANYVFPTNTTLGGYLRYQSGRPWEARGRDPLYNTPYVYFEEAGSRRTSSWTNFDFLVGQSFRLGPGEVTLSATVLNLFDEQPELAVDDSFCLGRPCNPRDPTTPTIDDIPASNRNPNFGNARIYAQPRRFAFSVGYTF